MSKTKPKAKRADFAISGGRFPLNTPGRCKVASSAAEVSFKKGNISKAEMDKVKASAKKCLAKKKG